MHVTRSQALLTVTAASLLVVGAVATGGLAASDTDDASVTAAPPDPGERSVHSVTVTVGADSNGSWTGLRVAYGDSGADVSDVGVSDLLLIGIDRGDDTEGVRVDQNVTVSTVSASDDGTTLLVGLDGSASLSSGDEVVVVFGDARNPPTAGNYTVSLDVNPQSSGGTATATLRVAEGAITFRNQTSRPSTDGSSVTVRSVTLPDGGYVVVTDADGTLVGHSSYLRPGTHENVTVALGGSLETETRLTAVAHRDDGDGTFESPGEDPPYLDDGQPVADTAVVRPASGTTTTTTSTTTQSTTTQSTTSETTVATTTVETTTATTTTDALTTTTAGPTTGDTETTDARTTHTSQSTRGSETATTASDTTAAPPDTPGDDPTPGFTVVATVGVLLGVLVLARRSR